MVSATFQGLIVARNTDERGIVFRILCLAVSPRNCGQPPMLLECAFPGTNTPNTPGAANGASLTCGTLVHGHGSAVALMEEEFKFNSNHLRLRCGRSGVRPCPENRATLRFLRVLYDEFIDFQMASSIKHGFKYYNMDMANYSEQLALKPFRRRMERRLADAGLIVPGERPVRLHGWFYDFARMTDELSFAVISVWDAGGPPRVLVMRGEDRRSPDRLRTASCAVSISEKPKVLEGVVTLTDDQLRDAFDWIRQNRKALLQYWKGGYCDDWPISQRSAPQTADMGEDCQ